MYLKIEAFAKRWPSGCASRYSPRCRGTMRTGAWLSPDAAPRGCCTGQTQAHTMKRQLWVNHAKLLRNRLRMDNTGCSHPMPSPCAACSSVPALPMPMGHQLSHLPGNHLVHDTVPKSHSHTSHRHLYKERVYLRQSSVL